MKQPFVKENKKQCLLCKHYSSCCLLVNIHNFSCFEIDESFVDFSIIETCQRDNDFYDDYCWSLYQFNEQFKEKFYLEV